MSKVLVLGAGGFLGLNTVHACLDAGLKPRCGRRPKGSVLGLLGLGVELSVTDFENPDTLLKAMEGIDVVIHAAAHYPRFSHHPQATLQRGLVELESVLNAASAAKVKRLVLVSSTATVAPRAEGRASTEEDVYESAPRHGTYHQLKWELEQRALTDHRLEVVVANPSACIGPYDWKVGTSSLLLATARGARPEHPSGRISTVDARDVADALLFLATTPAPPKRLILSESDFDATELLKYLAGRYGAPAPPAPLSAERARAIADEQEVQAEQTRSRAQLPRELVDLIVHAPRLDASLAKRLGLSFRPLSQTLDAWDAWAQRMGYLAPREKRIEHVRRIVRTNREIGSAVDSGQGRQDSSRAPPA